VVTLGSAVVKQVKPSDFWITSPDAAYAEIHGVRPDPCDDLIHVIEKAAYEKVIESLKWYEEIPHDPEGQCCPDEMYFAKVCPDQGKKARQTLKDLGER